MFTFYICLLQFSESIVLHTPSYFVTPSCDFAMLSTLISSQKCQFEVCECIFGNQQFFLIEELSDDTLPTSSQSKCAITNSTNYPRRCRHCQRSRRVLRSTSLLHTCSMLTIFHPGNVITFHARMCNAKGCNGPCNHDDKTDVHPSYEYNESYLPFF